MKIISLVPSFTEIIFSLGLGNALVGVTEHCDYPPRAREINKVGTFAGPDESKIIALTPDLVCADPVLHRGCTEKIRTGGIKAYSPAMRTVADVLQCMVELAGLCGVPEAGREVVIPLRQRLADVQAGGTRKRSPRVVRLLGGDPFYMPGPGSVQYDAIKLAGGTPLPAGKGAYVEVFWPSLSDFDPEVLLLCGREKGEPAPPRCKGCIVKNPPCQRQVNEFISREWSGLTAVRENRVLPLRCHDLCRPGVRLIEGIEKLAAYFPIVLGE